MIAELIARLGPWAWIILGLVLVGLELRRRASSSSGSGLRPSRPGSSTLRFRLSWQAATLVFAVLSVAAVLVGRSLSRPMVQRRGRTPRSTAAARPSSAASSRSMRR